MAQLREGLRELWIIAKRALWIFLIAWLAIFVVLYALAGLGLILSFIITTAASGAIAGAAFQLAVLPEQLETEAARARDEAAARELLEEVRRQGPRRPDRRQSRPRDG